MRLRSHWLVEADMWYEVQCIISQEIITGINVVTDGLRVMVTNEALALQLHSL